MPLNTPQAGDANWAGSGGVSGTKLNATLQALYTELQALGVSLTGTNASTALNASNINDIYLAIYQVGGFSSRIAAAEASIALLLNPPNAQLRQTTLQSLANNTFNNSITFTTEDWDTHSGHSTVSNTSRYTVPVGGQGKYELTGGVGFAANATGVRGTIWRKNGNDINGSQVLLPNCGASLNTLVPAKTIQVDLIAADYVELGAYQNSGAGLNTTVSTSDQSFMGIKRIRST